MQPAIEVDGLTKRYGEQTVVDGVTFDVGPGTVLCLLGRNGAGKTTTVECIEGFRTADSGRVRVLGHDPVAQRASVIARMGVMLQDGGAYQAATPREMLRLYARLFPRTRPLDEVLEVVSLHDRADRRFRTLSGGEKQRVNLALALIGRPDVLFLDEPTAGMDPGARRSTWDVLESLRAEGVAVLLTTHFMDEAQRLADVVAIIHQGRLLAVDRLDALTGPGRGLEVTSPAAVDVEDLAAGLDARVRPLGPGRYLVDVAPERLPEVAAWFADRQVPLTGVNQAGASLEDVFLELTGGAE